MPPLAERLSSGGLSIAPFDFEALDGEASSIYALTLDLRIGFVNRGFCDFARQNGAPWEVGALLDQPVMNAIPQVLKPFYRRLLEQAAAEQRVVEHDYECSSPSAYRRFRMRLHPCASGALLVVNNLLEETPRASPDFAALEATYRGKAGFMSQCTHCRCVRRPDEPNRWDFVPALLERPQLRISHGLCRVCADYYYPEDGRLPRFPERR